MEALEVLKIDLKRLQSIGGFPIEPFEVVAIVDRIVAGVVWSKTSDLTNTEMRRACKVDSTPTTEGALHWLSFLIGQLGQHVFS